MAVMKKVALLLAFPLLFAFSSGCSSDPKKNGGDSAQAGADSGHEHEGPGITKSFADSVIAASGHSAPQDTVKMVALPPMYEGDIVFQNMPGDASKQVGLVTRSKFNHMGIVFIKPRTNEFVVMEALGDSIRLFTLREWVNRGEGQHVLVLRLKGANKILDEKKSGKLKMAARSFRKKPVDAFFSWDDDHLYCSELVWKIYKQGLNISLSEPQKLKNFDLSDEAVKKKMKEHYNNAIPLNDNAVSPQDIIDSKLLEKVYER